MAKVNVLVEGYTNADARNSFGEEKTCATITLVREKDMVIVVDPGVLDNQQILIEALKNKGLTVDDVTIVCITHSHIDHYKNTGMFSKAKVLEYFGMWDGGKVEDWQENFSEDIQILKTPGHDYTSITLFVKTDDGVVAICGDVFWKKDGPKIDPYAQDVKKLEHSRELVVQHSHWIIPGHAGIYKTEHGHRLIKTKNGQKVEMVAYGKCKKCHRAFQKLSDKCPCQEWLCYHCCECDIDCLVCHCKHKI
jgi:glyoxylase-like metal-dependent hydrolase (beta-lactamase superfamily II)